MEKLTFVILNVLALLMCAGASAENPLFKRKIVIDFPTIERRYGVERSW